MSKEILNALYNTENYYHITTPDESRRFLKLSGYSEEEIKSILEIEKERDMEEKEKEQRIVANSARVYKKKYRNI